MDWFIYLILLIASAEDIYERKVKNALLLLLAAAMLAELLLLRFQGPYSSLLDRVAASLLTFVCFALHGLRSGGIGGADIKTASLLSFRSGLARSFLIVPLSFALMLMYFLIRKISSRPVNSAPYVPFISTAYFVVMQIL